MLTFSQPTSLQIQHHNIWNLQTMIIDPDYLRIALETRITLISTKKTISRKKTFIASQVRLPPQIILVHYPTSLGPSSFMPLRLMLRAQTASSFVRQYPQYQGYRGFWHKSLLHLCLEAYKKKKPKLFRRHNSDLKTYTIRSRKESHWPYNNTTVHRKRKLPRDGSEERHWDTLKVSYLHCNVVKRNTYSSRTD